MELYIVRHGQSQSNAGEDVRDPALTALGARQARLAGEALRDVPFDKVYASHLTRAVQTAAGILSAQPSPPVMEIVPELAECGDRDHVAEEDHLRTLWHAMEIHGLRSRPFADDAARAAWCLEQCVYANAYEGDLPVTGQTGEGEQRENRLRVLIVSHGVFNAHLIGQLVGFPFDRNMVVSQYNACVNRFQLYTVNGVRRIRFRCFNNTAHLPEEMLT